MDIVTRKDALANGLKHYYTGKPCLRGHDCQRHTTAKSCVECCKHHDKERGSKRKDYFTQWRATNPDYFVDYYTENRDKARAYYEEHREYYIARAGVRRQQEAAATPAWLTSADRSGMNALYEEARRLTAETGTAYEVDHILPILGDFVCGLHVPSNLRVVTRRVNRKKRNKIDDSLLSTQLLG